MAEEKKAEVKQEKQEKKEGKAQKEKHEARHEAKHEIRDITSIVRIASTDVPGEMNVLHGLTLIKGISFSMSNAICHSLNFDRGKKVITLTSAEIDKISTFIKNPSIPKFLLNRRFDRNTGESKHLIMSDLDLAKEFDIRHFKKIRSYKGLRHALGLPVRGQRTRSHFRKGRAIGVRRGKTIPAAKKEEKGGKGK